MAGHVNLRLLIHILLHIVDQVRGFAPIGMLECWNSGIMGSGMSMSNNIAEGSGSSSKKEFRQFLNIARRSTFENANILILLQRRKLITREALDRLLDELDSLCRQITSFQKSLK